MAKIIAIEFKLNNKKKLAISFKKSFIVLDCKANGFTIFLAWFKLVAMFSLLFFENNSLKCFFPSVQYLVRLNGSLIS
ncbi:hypothetical protein BpHYR1_000962 [Brachionus plicatilis]|uniref:Uncharacterized protein n=1 Tax=Brachionus plicatilis TaxID=10195 RepID=A0A3M7RD67_BRAPC|nr:hypothetical protein BpHYR1_000962 [Brachionus plicatilis]